VVRASVCCVSAPPGYFICFGLAIYLNIPPANAHIRLLRQRAETLNAAILMMISIALALRSFANF